MAFTGKESEKVTLQEAANWTANYRATIKEGEILSHFYGKNNLTEILEQKDCQGIRIYHGIDDGQKNLILVGADGDENDMINGVLVERGVPCPPRCKEKNVLNS